MSARKAPRRDASAVPRGRVRRTRSKSIGIKFPSGRYDSWLASSWPVQDRLRPVEGTLALLQTKQRLCEFAHGLHPAFAIKRHQVGGTSDGDAVIPVVEEFGR